MRRLVLASCAAAALALVGAARVAVAQPPNQTGVTWTPLADVDLGGELGFQGRGLRSRLVTLPPGGLIPAHSHTDRPSVMYMVEGTVVEHRGAQATEHHQGESFQIGKDTPHSIENTSGAKAAYIETDVYKKGS
ncbi:MAG TPA: cupin domain-containing protein [Vicinamibacterales bacterium]